MLTPSLPKGGYQIEKEEWGTDTTLVRVGHRAESKERGKGMTPVKELGCYRGDLNVIVY